MKFISPCQQQTCDDVLMRNRFRLQGNRNLVIARVFRELELAEQWGSGIPGIFQRAKAENLPEPIIEDTAGRLRFTVALPEILPLTREQSSEAQPFTRHNFHPFPPPMSHPAV